MGSSVQKAVVYKIRGGWAAEGDGWAVHGSTRAEVLRKYEEALREHELINTLPPPSRHAPHSHEGQEAL